MRSSAKKLAQVIRTKMNGLDELKDLVTEQISACGVTDRKERIPETVIADINGALKDFSFRVPERNQPAFGKRQNLKTLKS